MGMVGIAKERDELYLLSPESNGPKVLSSSILSHPTASQVWLQHNHLGHPSFSLLKSMFPTLFLQESVESFKRDVCQFAK